MGSLTYQQVNEVNKERCALWHPGFPNDPWNLADWSNAVCGEAGELANVIKKIRRIEGGASTVGEKGRDELTVDALYEAADVALYLDLLVTRLDGPYSLEQAIARKFNQKSHEQGFPQRLIVP
jgi:hypothetical protein